MTQHIHSYSGHNYDRWVERHGASSTFGKVQKQFWFTKSAVIRKLGKKEDEHIVASDAELDAKIELFKAVEASTKELRILLADYQNRLCVLAQEENSLGRLLKEYGKHDKSRAGKMMIAVGKSLSYTAQQRVALRNPLVRLFQEVDTFYCRAVEDTAVTVSELEKVRTEYRGALMWMKDISQDFNPDQFHQLEKFREVQSTVRQKKAVFDQLKIKSLQKIDLLAASRCNMFSHALILYQNNLITFSDKTAKTLNTVLSNFKDHQPYDFQIIKELADPTLKDTDDSKSSKDAFNNDDETFFNAEFHDDDSASTVTHKVKKSDSLVNLLEDKEVASKERETEEFKNFDLLTESLNFAEAEKDSQQILKEIFDSPVHQTLPIFGDENMEASLLSNDPVSSGAGTKSSISLQTLQSAYAGSRSFLPSQLLDSGILSWKKSPDISSMSGELNIAQNIEKYEKEDLKKLTKAPGPSKVDWYKIFQDIDPLADPSNEIFGKLLDSDNSC